MILVGIYVNTFKLPLQASARGNLSIVSYGAILLAVTLYARSEKSPLTTSAFFLSAVMLSVHIAGLLFKGHPEGFANVISVIMNVVFFGYSLWLLGYGIQRRLKSNFMLGTVLILLLAFGRYLDYFDDYVVGAVVFMGSGLLIYFVNNYWNRKYV